MKLLWLAEWAIPIVCVLGIIAAVVALVVKH